MDNASKAIVIAGSVMIAVLVITLFLWFYNNIRLYSMDTSAQRTDQQAQAFNRFFVYCYNEQDGHKIKTNDAYNVICKAYDLNQREDYHYINITFQGKVIANDSDIVWLNGRFFKNGNNINKEDFLDHNKIFREFEMLIDPAKDFVISIDYGSDGFINKIAIQ